MSKAKSHGENYYAAIFLGIVLAIGGGIFLVQSYLTEGKKADEKQAVKTPQQDNSKRFEQQAKRQQEFDVAEELAASQASRALEAGQKAAPRPQQASQQGLTSSALAGTASSAATGGTLEAMVANAQGLYPEPLNQYVEQMSDAGLFIGTLKGIADGQIVDDLLKREERLGAKQQISSINFYTSRSSKKISYSFANNTAHLRANFAGRQVSTAHVMVTLKAQKTGKNIKTVFVKTIPEGRRSNVLLSSKSPLLPGPYEVRIFELSQHVPLVAHGEFVVR